jgi:ribose transport system substrate-binding protein
MKTLPRVLSCLTIVCSIAACGPAPSTDPNVAQDRAKKIVGAALLTQTHVFYQDLVEAMEAEAEVQGIEIVVQYAEFDGAKQNAQMQTFVLQEVDAIVVSPKDSAAIAPAINEARREGIPVFTTDIAAHGVEVVSHIASDNVRGGEILGEHLAELLDGKGRVAIIDHPEAASVQERVAGFEKALAKYPEMVIVQKVPGGALRDKAMRATQDLLQANPDIDAIFGINDDSALGALAAVESAGLQDRILLVGYDGTPEARGIIRAGRALVADTVQYPRDIGRTTVRTVAAHLDGETVPKVVPVDVGIITKESLEAEHPPPNVQPSP